MNRRPFFFAFVFALAAVIFSVFLPRLLPLWLAPALFGTVLALFRSRRWLLTGLLCVLTLLWCGFRTSRLLRPALPLPEGTVTVTGLAESCALRDGQAHTVLRGVTVTQGGKTVTTTGIELTLSPGKTVEPGDLIRAAAFLNDYAAPAENPGETSMRLEKLADRITGGGAASSCTVIAHRETAATALYRLRTLIYGRMSAYTANDESTAMLYACLTGDRQYVPSYVRDSFAACGTAHLLAVSGLHVNLLMGLVYLLFRKLPARFRLVPVGLVLVFYGFLTGFSPSVMRASLMSGVLLVTRALGYRHDPLHALSLAGWLALVLDPMTVFDLSFQLSFLACFGLLAFGVSPAGTRRLVSSVRVTAAASLATLPINLCTFGTVSLMTVPANLVTVPLAGTALLMTAVFLLLSLLIPPLGWLMKLPHAVMTAVTDITRLMARVPVWKLPTPSWLLPAAGIPLLLLLSRFVLAPRRKTLCACVLIPSVLLAGFAPALLEKTGDYVRLPAMESEHLFIHVHAGEDVLIGLPTEDSYRLLSYLTATGTSCDTLILLTQAEADALPALTEAGFSARQIVVTDPSVRAFGARFLAPGTSIAAGKAVLSAEKGGLTVLLNGHRLLVQWGEMKDAYVYELALTCRGDTRAKSAVTKETLSLSVPEYAADHFGCVTVFVGKTLRIVPYHKEKIL